MLQKSVVVQLLDDIDIAYMNECFDSTCDSEYLKALEKTARILVEASGLRNYTGLPQC